MSPDSDLAMAILVELAQAPPPGVVSLPRISKRLGVGASVLLRELSLMGDARIGSSSGPGWVQVEQTEDRWLLHLTPAGRAFIMPLMEQAAADPAEPGAQS